MASEMSQAQRRPFQEGEPVLILEPRGHRHMTRLKAGEVFHHQRTGHIYHDDLIGRPPGLLKVGESGEEAICQRPTLEEYILKKLHRRTSIIHPKDLAPLFMRGDLFPGARVLEAGIGSGSTAITLLRFLGPQGQLISYERRREFIDLAAENIAAVRQLFGDDGTPHKILEKDVYQGIEERGLDTIIMDVPEPHRASPTARQALRAGGILLCWLPSVNQVYATARELQREARWGLVEVTESWQREWQVAENAMRPFHRMIGHTGFLVRARKLVEA